MLFRGTTIRKSSRAHFATSSLYKLLSIAWFFLGLSFSNLKCWDWVSFVMYQLGGRCDHMYTVSIHLATKTLPLYFISSLLFLNKSFLSIHKWWNNCSVLFKITLLGKVRCETPLNTNKNEVNIQMFVFNIITLKFPDDCYYFFCKPASNTLEKVNI